MMRKAKKSPSSRPRAAHGQRRGDLMAAGRACFAELGIEGATVDDILGRSGATVGSLYQHFRGKDGLAAALYVEGLELFFAKARARLRSAQTVEDGAKAIVRAYFDCAETDPLTVAFLIEARDYVERSRFAGEIARKNQEFMPEVVAFFRDAIRNGAVRAIAPDYIMAILEGPARHVVKRWLRSPKRPLAEAREVLAQAAWDALSPPRR